MIAHIQVSHSPNEGDLLDINSHEFIFTDGSSPNTNSRAEVRLGGNVAEHLESSARKVITECTVSRNDDTVDIDCKDEVVVNIYGSEVLIVTYD